MKVALFGGGFDTKNLGVSALTQATIDGMGERLPETEFIVFDHSKGRSEISRPGNATPYIRQGATWSRRLYRSDSLRQIAWCAKLGGLWNRSARDICRAQAVLDVSGGDSFTDLYGDWRFHWVVLPKLLAIRSKVPLFLLPQTYGPFLDPRLKSMATEIIRHADMCWARDERSFKVLRELAGPHYDEERHRCGVDLAFGLSPRNASDLMPARFMRLLASDRAAHPVVGFNVSGLIYNDPVQAEKRYGFKAHYKTVIVQFIRWLLEETAASVVLIPHVVTQGGHRESDPDACSDVASIFDAEFHERILVAPATLDQSQVKWLISCTNWFCGTRMHATIAALSSGIPTATIAYSDKAQGVFETCGQGAHVFDPRVLETPAVIEELKNSFRARSAVRESLINRLPFVNSMVDKQLNCIASGILSAREKLTIRA